MPTDWVGWGRMAPRVDTKAGRTRGAPRRQSFLPSQYGYKSQKSLATWFPGGLWTIR